MRDSIIFSHKCLCCTVPCSYRLCIYQKTIVTVCLSTLNSGYTIRFILILLLSNLYNSMANTSSIFRTGSKKQSYMIPSDSFTEFSFTCRECDIRHRSFLVLISTERGCVFIHHTKTNNKTRIFNYACNIQIGKSYRLQQI